MKRLMLMPMMLVAAAVQAATGFSHNEFYIGVQCVPAQFQSEQHIKDIRDCGVDFIGGFREATDEKLNLLQRYGLSIMEHRTPRVWDAGKWDEFQENLRQHGTDYRAEIDEVRRSGNHPAISYSWICDEPKAMHYDYLAEVATYANRHLPQAPAFVNLLPIYAKVAESNQDVKEGQLGTRTYDEYIEQYCQKVPTDMVSVDVYPVPVGDGEAEVREFEMYLFPNLQIVADACRKYGRDFLFDLQANTRSADGVKMNEDILRRQAYLGMAYGATRLSWACWTGEDVKYGGWWFNNVLDKDGNKTPVYGQLKKVNWEVKAIAKDFMRFRNIDTLIVGSGKYDEDFTKKRVRFAREFNDGFVNRLATADRSYLAVGSMLPRAADSDERAYFVVGAADPLGRIRSEHAVRFVVSGQVRVLDANGPVVFRQDKNGKCAFQLKDSHAALIIVDPYR